MAMMFWDLEGILHMDYMPHRTIDGDAYDSVLCNLEAIKEKQRNVAKGTSQVTKSSCCHNGMWL
jgi:hypothetical protein